MNGNFLSVAMKLPYHERHVLSQVPDVAIRTLERDIRGLQLVLPGGRVPWIFEGCGGGMW